MIYYFTPYQKGNLGSAYNHYCSLVPDKNDWITFIDGDVMTLYLDWADRWEKILYTNDDAGIIAASTNRAAMSNLDQVHIKMFQETDILKHKEYAEKLFLENYTYCEIMQNQYLSGFFFSFKKQIWLDVNGFKDGILGVDTDFYEKVRQYKSCLVSKGFYVLHYYRFLENKTDGLFIDHLL